MKKTITLLCCLLAMTYLYSQLNSFSGSIMYSDKKNLPATLEINIDSSYQITGTCSRSFQGKSVNHYLTGTFNPKDLSIYLREYANYKNDCPIYIQGWVHPLIQNLFVIAGIFKSLDSTRCEKGHINVINRNFKFNLYDTSARKMELTEEEEDSILNNLLNKKLNQEKNYISVKSDDKIVIKSTGEPFYLKIFDQLKIDGDMVKIVFNETVVSNNLVLNEKPYIQKFTPIKGQNVLKIYAINEGKLPMNTSKVELYNHRFQEYFINLLYKNQSATYIFNYE